MCSFFLKLTDKNQLKCIEAQHLQNDDRERPVEHAQEQFNTWQDRVMGAVDVLSVSFNICVSIR